MYKIVFVFLMHFMYDKERLVREIRNNTKGEMRYGSNGY